MVVYAERLTLVDLSVSRAEISRARARERERESESESERETEGEETRSNEDTLYAPLVGCYPMRATALLCHPRWLDRDVAVVGGARAAERARELPKQANTR